MVHSLRSLFIWEYSLPPAFMRGVAEILISAGGSKLAPLKVEAKNVAPFSSEEILMKYSCSLKLNHIFQRLYRTNGFANGNLVLYARKNRSATNRVGITVSKKLGHAVVRNRIRRRFREAYRLNEDKFQPGWDIVLVARSRAISADFEDLTQSLLKLADKAGILK